MVEVDVTAIAIGTTIIYYNRSALCKLSMQSSWYISSCSTMNPSYLNAWCWGYRCECYSVEVLEVRSGKLYWEKRCMWRSGLASRPTRCTPILLRRLLFYCTHYRIIIIPTCSSPYKNEIRRGAFEYSGKQNGGVWRQMRRVWKVMHAYAG